MSSDTNHTIDLHIESKSPYYPDSLNNSWMTVSPEKIERLRKNVSTEKIIKNQIKSAREVE